MAATIKTITLENEVIEYVGKQGKIESRNFSNMVNVIVKRYKRISEQLEQGTKIDVSFAK